jgi:acyl-CoA thioesterase FadM
VQGYPFSCPIQVRYADIDAMNHVNNAVYATYLEVARVRLWEERLDFTGSAREIPFILHGATLPARSFLTADLGSLPP